METQLPWLLPFSLHPPKETWFLGEQLSSSAQP